MASADVAPISEIGAPQGGTVPPGECVLGEDWSPATLVERKAVSPSTFIFTFALPDPTKSLGLSTCACILAKGGLEEPVIRPYTPISTQRLVGKFELMIKIYEQGAFSQFIAQLPIGGTVEFKHIPFNVKIQYPFRKQVGMLCGGTGVTPMLQALHAVLGTEGDETEKVAMVYGSRSSDDILAGPTLDAWAAESGGKFTCTHVLSHEPEGSAWPGARGFISRQLVETHLPAPGDDTHVFVCGPPAMYEALCGPRDQKEVSGLLAEMGYTAEQVFKF